MEEEFKPVFKEMVIAYGLASAVMWGLAASVVLVLSLPGAYVAPLLQLSIIPAAVFFVVKSASALFLHLTERYYLGDGAVRMQRGLFSRETDTVPLHEVGHAGVVVSMLFRAFGVGTVWVHTNDCLAYPLYNLRDAMVVRDKIDPPPAGEPVFRPSVG